MTHILSLQDDIILRNMFYFIQGGSTEIFVVFECLESMKRDKRVSELASQTSIRIDLLHVCLTDLR